MEKTSNKKILNIHSPFTIHTMQTEKEKNETQLSYYKNLKKAITDRVKILEETIEQIGEKGTPESRSEALKLMLEANNHLLDKLNCEKEIIAKDRYVKMYEQIIQDITNKEIKDTEDCEKFWNDSVKMMNEIPESKIKKLPPALQVQFNEIKKDNANPESIIYKKDMQHNKNARFQLMTKMIHHLQNAGS